VLLAIVASYAIWWAMLYVQQDRILFNSTGDRETPGKIEYPQARILKVNVDGGTVDAMFISAADKPGMAPAPVVIYFHSGGDAVDQLSGVIITYWGMGFSVLLPEYRGFGRASGKPSEAALQQDMTSFYDQLVQQPDVDATRIVYHGRALGGAVAASLAAVRPPKAMILESTFQSFTTQAATMALPWFLVRNPYRTDEVVARLGRPLLIAHGTKDDLFSIDQARALRDVADASMTTYVEFNCGHEDFPGLGKSYLFWAQVTRFLKSNGLAPGSVMNTAASISAP
jgi:fermentation-respiration switch protein FrsA (DUF1100 family)